MAFPLLGKDPARHGFVMALDDFRGAPAGGWLFSNWWIHHKVERVLDKGTSFEPDRRSDRGEDSKRTIPACPRIWGWRGRRQGMLRHPDANCATATRTAMTSKAEVRRFFLAQDCSRSRRPGRFSTAAASEMIAGRDGRLYVQTRRLGQACGTLRAKRGLRRGGAIPAVGQHFIQKFFPRDITGRPAVRHRGGGI